MAKKEPAAIRYLNPGAMWPNPIATKWGSTSWLYLKDGTGQGGGGKGNRIAVFKNWVDGICAQLDLWRSSANYRNKRFADAIDIWCGHNDTPGYIRHVKTRIPGMTENTIMNDEFWRGANGLKFLKVQAAHEAGKEIPASAADWTTAQQRVMYGKAPMTPANKAKVATTAGSVTTTTATAAAGVQSGWPWWTVFIIILFGLGVAIGAAWFFGRQKEIEVDDDVEPPSIIRTPTSNELIDVHKE